MLGVTKLLSWKWVLCGGGVVHVSGRLGDKPLSMRLLLPAKEIRLAPL